MVTAARIPTHEVFNQFAELADYDLLATDAALREALARAGEQAALPQLDLYGAQLGSAAAYQLALDANRHAPTLHAFDTRGRRVNQVEFHPSWHVLMALYRAQGLVAQPFRDAQPGRWSAWAAGFYLHGQIEQGSLCPATMTTAGIPVLQKEPQHLTACITCAARDCHRVRHTRNYAIQRITIRDGRTLTSCPRRLRPRAGAPPGRSAVGHVARRSRRSPRVRRAATASAPP